MMGAVRKDGYSEFSLSCQASVLQLPVVVVLQAAPACGQHAHSSTMVPWDPFRVLWQAHRVLAEFKQLPCSGSREANQVEQRPRRGLLSRVLYRTTAMRIWIRSG